MVAAEELGVCVWEAICRAVAAAATLCAAIVMGTNKQTYFGIKAKYSYSPAFTYFVVANAVACAYAALSLPVASKKIGVGTAKLAAAVIDVFMVAIVMSGASAATAIAYVGHKGNSHSGWMAICGTFDRFCDHVGGALAVSYVGCLLFIALVTASLHAFWKRSAKATEI